MSQINRYIKAYIVIALFTILGKTSLTIWHVDHPVANMFSWLWVIVTLVAGLLSMWLAGYARFKTGWDRRAKSKYRFSLPISFGVTFAILTIVLGVYINAPNFNAPFPYSIPTYLTFGTLYEIISHLIPAVLLTWLISTVVLRKRYNTIVFWVVALLISLFEPYTQVSGLMAMNLITAPLDIAMFALLIYLSNITQLALFRRYGFLSMIIFRYSHYIVWHIIWPVVYF